MLSVIKKCVAHDEILSTYPVMRQLRPSIKDEDYLGIVTAMQETDRYQLVGAYTEDGQCVAVAGIRFRRSLFRGGERELYVDDLVTDEAHRSTGIGHDMMNWLKTECKKEGCVGLVLDSGLTRSDAHRFYKREGMESTALHFYRPKSPEPPEQDGGAAPSFLKK